MVGDGETAGSAAADSSARDRDADDHGAWRRLDVFCQARAVTSPHTSPTEALRDAAAALRAGRVAAGRDSRVADPDKHAVHRETAAVLDELSGLLGAAGAVNAHDQSPADAGMMAVNQHLTAAADIARRRSTVSAFDTPPTGMPRTWL